MTKSRPVTKIIPNEPLSDELVPWTYSEPVAGRVLGHGQEVGDVIVQRETVEKGRLRMVNEQFPTLLRARKDRARTT